MSFVTRFAPSPTGRLHRGHAFSALTAFDAARQAGGRFLLRLEDIDSARCKPAFEEAILEDLAWLGLAWEQPVRRQSEHMADYRAALAKLEALGVLYLCQTTRREVLEAIGRAPHGVGTEPRESRPIKRGEGDETEAFAWRLDARAALQRGGGEETLTIVERHVGAIPLRRDLIGDVVLGRKDIGVAYHLAVVVDDALQGVTEVIRGEDLAPAAHVQRLLQFLLDLPPVIYRHHPLLLRPDGKRFAKRDTAETLADLRARAVTPAELRRELGLAAA